MLSSSLKLLYPSGKYLRIDIEHKGFPEVGMVKDGPAEEVYDYLHRDLIVLAASDRDMVSITTADGRVKEVDKVGAVKTTADRLANLIREKKTSEGDPDYWLWQSTKSDFLPQVEWIKRRPRTFIRMAGEAKVEAAQQEAGEKTGEFYT